MAEMWLAKGKEKKISEKNKTIRHTSRINQKIWGGNEQEDTCLNIFPLQFPSGTIERDISKIVLLYFLGEKF